MRAYVYIWIAAALIIAAAAVTQATAQAAVTTGVDVDTGGNEANSLGAIESCRTVEEGDSFDVDVFVKGVPPASGFSNGLSGFAFNLQYDPAVLEVTAIDAGMMLAAAGPRNPFEVADDLPDSDGNFRVDEADLGRNFESGDGVLLRVTLRAVGGGLSTLVLGDDAGAEPDHIPDVLGAAGVPLYAVAAIHNAAIGVDAPCTAPTPEVITTPSPAPGTSPGASPGASPGGSPQPGDGTPDGTAEPEESPTGTAGPTGGEGNGNGESEDDDGGLSTGAVIAIVVGIAGAATALGAGAWIVRRRSRPS